MRLVIQNVMGHEDQNSQVNSDISNFQTNIKEVLYWAD